MLRRARTARLATADVHGHPQCVPVCFDFNGRDAVIVLDAKPKSVPLRSLKRVRNIEANPHVCLTVDEYSEDWAALSYQMLFGRATVIDGPQPGAVARLRKKYPQYREMAIDDAPVIVIVPEKITSWSSERASSSSLQP